MCLYVNQKATKSMRARLKKSPRTFYKLLTINFAVGKVVSPYKQTDLLVWDDYIVSNRTLTTMTPEEAWGDGVLLGIHVFTEQEYVDVFTTLIDRTYCNSTWSNPRVRFAVKVQGHLEDFVAVGGRTSLSNKEAVFTKVKVNTKDLSKVASKYLKMYAQFKGRSMAKLKSKPLFTMTTTVYPEISVARTKSKKAK